MISDIFRTYVAGLLSPTSFLGVMLIISTILFWKGKTRIGKVLVTFSTVFYILLSTGPLKTISYSIFETERQTLPQDYRYVVVLGGKIFPNETHPLSSQISSSLLSRLSHGVYLTLKNPESKLIVTGNGAGEIQEALLMKEFALQMGLPPERIIVEDKSMNTQDHPVYLEPILKNQTFLLVTSAYHMKRALKNFRAHGLEGIPAPTDYMNKDQSGITAESFIMRGENLSLNDRLMTETYSTIWTAIRMAFK